MKLENPEFPLFRLLGEHSENTLFQPSAKTNSKENPHTPYSEKQPNVRGTFLIVAVLIVLGREE